DTRFKTADIISHDDMSIEAILVENIESIKLHCEANIPDVIAIDEIQFLGGEIKDIIDSINNFLERDITVIVAGLDVDFEGRPFEIVKELMPIADYLTKHHAVCVKCGSDAWISHRKTKDKERVVIGASREYEPLCRSCYLKEKKEEEEIINKNQVTLL
ncbi:hypothetical protein P7M08_25215, partial [Vibrio parahaemolyticus]|nr:hypothetical protein [Vibrio parahaemolyticus]NMR88582.1 thymidine kinase [Vibrio parahaemolyticus]